MDREPADHTLIQRVQAGDESALRLLLDRYESFLRAQVDKRLPRELRRKLAVEDVLQEVYLTAVKRFDDFEMRQEGAFAAWLVQIASFKVREEVRRYRETDKRGASREVTRGARPETGGFVDDGPSPSQVAIGEELRTRAEAAMAALPEDYREVLELVQAERLTMRQAAERMGRSREAVKKLYGRALARLATLLEP